MKVGIYTFSGTGNTYISADFIARSLKALGADVAQYKIEEELKKGSAPDFAGVDYIIIGYPIYAFNAPEIVIDFVKSFPKTTEIKAAVFKTAGEPFCLNKSSSSYMKRILEKKGYDFIAEKHILMPYNILFRYEDALAKQMYIFMQNAACDFAQTIAAGERELIKSTALGRAVSVIMRPIMRQGAKLNGRFYSVSKKKCVMCMKCVRECPTGNIAVKDGKLHFDGNCAMCMRCVQLCPKDAIKIGLVQPFKVRMGYDFESLAADEHVPSDFINHDTRGYFRLFRKFFGVK